MYNDSCGKLLFDQFVVLHDLDNDFFFFIYVFLSAHFIVKIDKDSPLNYDVQFYCLSAELPQNV